MTRTATLTPSVTLTYTPSFTATASHTYSLTPTPSFTTTRTPTVTPGNTATVTPSSTPTGTAPPTSSPTDTLTPGPTATPPPGLLVLGANLYRELSDPPLPVYYQVPQGGEVQLMIYSIVARPVRHLAGGSIAAGAYSASWDGKEDSGEPVAPGIYLVVLTEPGHTVIKKLLVLKQ
jgi:hypothetical protein